MAYPQFELIREWARMRNLIPGDVNRQALKLFEEAGEVAAGLARSDLAKTVDAIGDTVVVLTILAEQVGVPIENCIAAAYGEIKSRTGSTVNGVFVKDEE